MERKHGLQMRIHLGLLPLQESVFPRAPGVKPTFFHELVVIRPHEPFKLCDGRKFRFCRITVVGSVNPQWTIFNTDARFSTNHRKIRFGCESLRVFPFDRVADIHHHRPPVRAPRKRQQESKQHETALHDAASGVRVA
ncbi:MAG: hypothetical protein LBO79_06690 [Zoogloeaceae bacterium]|nr:hypothetical protein [Zoogloeaceae bacterium]